MLSSNIKCLRAPLWALWSVLLVALGGCTTDLVDRSVELSLSQTKIILDEKSLDASVEVRMTGAESWSYVLGVDWLSCRTEGNTLLLKAQPNLSGRLRTTTLSITAGSLMQTLQVEQAPQQSAITTDQPSYSMHQWGGSIVIPIHTIGKDWEALSSESWIQVRSNLVKQEILVSVDETHDRAQRKGRVMVRNPRSGDHLFIDITQDGIMYMILPYIGFGEDMALARAFEKERRSKLVSQPGSSEGGFLGLPNRDLWKFETYSPLFSRLEYRVDDDGRIVQAYAYSAFDRFHRELDAVKAFLSDQGFVAKGGSRYYNPDREILIEAASSPDNRESFLLYSYYPKQPKAQPTFDVFPAGLVSSSSWTTYTKERIHEWETKHGGVTANPEGEFDPQTEMLTLIYKPSDPDIQERTYKLYLPEKATPLINVSNRYKAEEAIIEKFFWRKGEAYYLTEEFIALAGTAGFRYLSENEPGQFIFMNEELETIFGIRVVLPDPESSDKPYVVLEFTP